MKPDFWFGLAITLCGLSIIVWSAWPKRPVPPHFQTLALWQAKDGQTGVIQWLDGIVTIEALKNHSFYAQQNGLTVAHVFHVEGRPVDPTWALSLQAAPQ